MKRAKVGRKCANPLFEKWLVEWKNEAKAKGSNVEKHFAKAIDSLQKYPLRLQSGRDCIILQNFGAKLCAMIDRKLKTHSENERRVYGSDVEPAETCDDIENDILPKKSRSLDGASTSVRDEMRSRYSGKKTKEKSPIPKRRAHSISSSDSNGRGSPLAEISDNEEDRLNVAALGRDKPKVSKKKSKDRIAESAAEERESEDIVGREIEREILTSHNKDEFLIAANNFDVLLLVDTHEIGSGKTTSKDDATKSELDRLSAPYEIRHLKIGDFAWVARCRDTDRELVLPYIVERKRMDDLASSIKDGRFHEQKFRLKQSGIPNLIYMVESYGNNQHIGIPLPTLLQAATNSLVQDGFTVKFTNSHRDSMHYLSIITTIIHKMYKEKSLVGRIKDNLDNACALSGRIPLMEFNQFNKSASKVKVFKVREMFVRQLLQLKGLSLEKVLAIVEHYPTPILLAKALKNAGSGGEKLLATIKVGAQNRQLGPAISKTIYELYTKTILE